MTDRPFYFRHGADAPPRGAPLDHVPVASTSRRRGLLFWLSLAGACALPLAYGAFLFIILWRS